MQPNCGGSISAIDSQAASLRGCDELNNGVDVLIRGSDGRASESAKEVAAEGPKLVAVTMTTNDEPATTVLGTSNARVSVL